MQDSAPPQAHSSGFSWPGTAEFALDFAVSSIDERSLARFGVPIPASLSRALLRRRFEFAAGRYCAQQALGALGAMSGPIGITDRRTPDWPLGIVGSITHAEGYAAAVVGPSSKFLGLGIDCELLLDESTAERIRALVITPGDAKVLAAAGLSGPLGTSLVFSAKESIYKCISPLTGTYFSFDAARLTRIDLQQGTFAFELLEGVGPGFPANFAHSGHMSFCGRHIHTGVAISR